MKKRLRCFLLLKMSMLASLLPSFAAIKLPAVFSDQMVLQQKTKVAVWGWAKPGEKITVSGSWSDARQQTVADANGKWTVYLRTTVAGGPYTLTVAGENTIGLNDVMIGEVWIASGQSNMATTLKSGYKGSEEASKANYPNIRYFSVKRQYGSKPFNDAPGSGWVKASPATAGSFSAVAYYFAKHLHDSLKVPVGIVFNAWGGTPAEAWTRDDILQNDKALSLYINRWKKIQEDAGKDSIAYKKALYDWQQLGSDTAKKDAPKKPAEPQSVYYFKRPWREPGVLFNGMLNPVIPYTIKGVIWYQGESNVAYADEYAHLLTRMIESWRNSWKARSKQNNFSFYIVQLAAYGYSNLDEAARLREAQQKVANQINKSGLAVTLDLGDMEDIHFTHKKEVGDRLALIALAKDYGFKKLVYAGPVSKKVSLDGNRVAVEFDQQLTSTGKPAGFEIGYKATENDSLIYVKAEARTEGDKVVVWNDKVQKPGAVRYGWLLPDKANLTNEKGLPAHPFRMKLK